MLGGHNAWFESNARGHTRSDRRRGARGRHSLLLDAGRPGFGSRRASLRKRSELELGSSHRRGRQPRGRRLSRERVRPPRPRRRERRKTRRSVGRSPTRAHAHDCLRDGRLRRRHQRHRGRSAALHVQHDEPRAHAGHRPERQVDAPVLRRDELRFLRGYGKRRRASSMDGRARLQRLRREPARRTSSAARSRRRTGTTSGTTAPNSRRASTAGAASETGPPRRATSGSTGTSSTAPSRTRLATTSATNTPHPSTAAPFRSRTIR